MIPMPAMQPMLPPEPICVQVSFNQETAGQHPPETPLQAEESKNNPAGLSVLDQPNQDPIKPVLVQADDQSVVSDQDNIDQPPKPNLEEGKDGPQNLGLLKEDQNPSGSGSSPLTSPQLPEGQQTEDQEPSAPLANENNTALNTSSDKLHSQTQAFIQDQADTVPVIILDQAAMTFELPENKGTVLEIEENGKIRTISLSEGFTTLALADGKVTIRLLDADGNVIQIWKTAGESSSSTPTAKPDQTIPSASNEQSDNLQVVKPEQDQPIFVARPDLSLPAKNPQMVAIQQVDSSTNVKPVHSELQKPAVSTGLQTTKPAAGPVQDQAKLDLPTLDLSLNQAAPSPSKADLRPRQDALSAALDELNTTPFPSILDALPPVQAPALNADFVPTTTVQSIAAPEVLQSPALASTQTTDLNAPLLNSTAKDPSLFSTNLPAAPQTTSLSLKPQASQIRASAPPASQDLTKPDTSILTTPQTIAKDRLNLAAGSASAANAVLKANKRSFQSGNRLYIKDPSALQVHVDHGSVQALEVRSQQTNKVYPDLEEAVKAEKDATFDVKAKIQSDTKQISQASWTVIPIGQPVETQVDTKAGHLNSVFTLSEEGKVVAYQQEKRQQPILCRGFDPIKTTEVRPGETLRMYIDDKPGTYQVRINGEEIQASLQQDELGQNYLSVPTKLGSTKLRILRDGKTVYSGSLECSNPFRSLKLVGPALGAAAGLILDVRRRKLF